MTCDDDTSSATRDADHGQSQDALAGYVRAIRVPRRVYFGAVTALLIANVVVVTVAWSRGEIAHTSLIPATTPAPSMALQTPSEPLRTAWATAEQPALGTPYWGGTVITHTADSVRGRDARTGATTWSYTRTDRTLCQVLQDQGVTVALFALDGNCDQVTALDSTTGNRRWTRTLDEDGAPLNGHPTYGLTADTIMLTTPGVIYAIDPISGLDRWVYQPVRCAVRAAVIGSAGALISQRCAKPPCEGLDFCGPGPQLLLRDATAPRVDDQAHASNPDQIKWNTVGSTAVPASADAVITALNRMTETLEVLAPDTGKAGARIPVQASPSDKPVGQSVGQTELIWVAGVTYALGLGDDPLEWTRATRGTPTTVEGSALVAALASPASVVLLNPRTGKANATFPVAWSARTSTRAYQFGTGFILADRSTRVYR